MLNMLNMLNRWAEIGPLNPKTFNIFNISPVLSVFSKKKNIWFLIVTNWATFVFLKRLFVKKHYKNRVSADFLFKKKGGPKIFNSY